MNRWSVESLIPSSLWLGLLLAAVLLLAWYSRRRPAVVTRPRWAVIMALMSLAVALVLLLLLNPTRVRQLPPPAGKSLLTLLVDSSGSMNTPDAGGQTRYQAAASAAGKLYGQLSDRFDLRIRTFTGSVAASDIANLSTAQPTGHLTDISAAIAACLDEERPQGQAVALLSDGAHNAGTISNVLDAARLARAMGSPIYTKTYGGDAGGFDLGIEMRSVQDIAFVGQKVLVTARVSHVGLVGAHPDVVLLEDGKEVARQQADIVGDLPAEVHFWVSRDKIGVYPYELRVSPLPGELTSANNAASYLLRVLDEPIRILQIEGKPYWDSKFLLRTLTEVPAVELDSAVRVTDGRIMWRTISRGEQGPATQSTTQNVTQSVAPAAAPASLRTEKWKVVTDPSLALASADALSHYQIIVLGRDAEPFLTEAAIANLQNWIAKSGGSLVCYRGSPTSQNSERLARLLPVKWTSSPESRFRVQMTSQGHDLHWLTDLETGAPDQDTLARMPTLAHAAQPQRSKPLAVVLASSLSAGSGEAAPAVVYQTYGAGRVVVIEGAGMWRWAFLPPEFQKQEEVYDALWHSMLRWLVSGTGLMPGQRLSLRAQKMSFSTEEPAAVNMLVREESLKGAPPAVMLTSESGGPEASFAPVAVADEPGVFRANFGKLPEGRYRVRVAGAGPEDPFSRTVFDVRRFGEEELDVKARPDLMQRIADDTGGAALGGDPVRELSSRFSEHLARAHPPRFERSSVWDRWWVLAIVLCAWTASWWLRRSGGLV
ncbi:MAG TPA: hypothetical protein VH370_23005 [Humisphaera sp.]|jgi:hypothetical protein|nr:hypothetical protein [Humisphaera sp.]